MHSFFGELIGPLSSVPSNTWATQRRSSTGSGSVPAWGQVSPLASALGSIVFTFTLFMGKTFSLLDRESFRLYRYYLTIVHVKVFHEEENAKSISPDVCLETLASRWVET